MNELCKQHGTGGFIPTKETCWECLTEERDREMMRAERLQLEIDCLKAEVEKFKVIIEKGWKVQEKDYEQCMKDRDAWRAKAEKLAEALRAELNGHMCPSTDKLDNCGITQQAKAALEEFGK